MGPERVGGPFIPVLALVVCGPGRVPARRHLQGWSPCQAG